MNQASLVPLHDADGEGLNKTIHEVLGIAERGRTMLAALNNFRRSALPPAPVLQSPASRGEAAARGAGAPGGNLRRRVRSSPLQERPLQGGINAQASTPGRRRTHQFAVRCEPYGRRFPHGVAG